MWYTIPHLWVKDTTYVVYYTTYVVYYTTNVVYYTTNVNSPEIPILQNGLKMGLFAFLSQVGPKFDQSYVKKSGKKGL